jgi:hypothetical protein
LLGDHRIATQFLAEGTIHSPLEDHLPIAMSQPIIAIDPYSIALEDIDVSNPALHDTDFSAHIESGHRL